MCVFRGNLSSKTPKCHISLMIYCKIHVCHLCVMYHVWSQIYATLRTRRKAIGRFTKIIQIDSLSWSSYDLRPNIIPPNFFWVKCVRFSLCRRPDWSWSAVIEISGNVPASSEDFQTLPKIKYPQMFRKMFEHFRRCLKNDNFSVLWFR